MNAFTGSSSTWNPRPPTTSARQTASDLLELHHQHHHHLQFHHQDRAIATVAAAEGTTDPIIRMEEYQRRIEEGRLMLRNANNHTNNEAVEIHLREACWYLEDWMVEFDEEVTTNAQRHSMFGNENPFATYLAQARHRLGQIALLKGDLNKASENFLLVLLHDPHTLSISAHAMTWYDVGVIFLKFGDSIKARYAFSQAYNSLMQQQDPTDIQNSEPLFKIIQHALMKCMYVVTPATTTNGTIEQNDGQVNRIASELPLSYRFSRVTYEFSTTTTTTGITTNSDSSNDPDEDDIDFEDSSDNDDGHSATSNTQFPQHDETVKRLFDPQAWAAGAA